MGKIKSRFICSFRRPVVKVKGFFERLAPNVPPRMFRRYFRMFPPTLTALTNLVRNDPILYQTPQYTRISVEKKVGMTCAYLGSSATTF